MKPLIGEIITNFYPMKRYIIFGLLVMFSMTQLEAQVTKSLVKSIPLDGATAVSLAFEHPVLTNTWNESYVRVVAEVEISNFTDAVLKKLIEAGRYNVISTLENGILTLSCPKLKTKVSIGGKELEEKVVFKFYAPAGLNFVVADNSVPAF